MASALIDAPLRTCCCPEVRLILRRVRPRPEQVLVLKQRVNAANSQPEKDAAGQRAAFFTGNQHVGACCAFGIGQRVVLLHNELAPQRNHEQDAEPAADQGEHEDAGVLKIESEKDEGGQGEDDAGGDRLPGVAGGLNNVVFENGSAAEGAKNADGKHRDGNGRGHGEPGAQAHIDSDGAEDEPEDAAQQHGAKGELGPIFLGRDKRLKLGQS